MTFRTDKIYPLVKAFLLFMAMASISVTSYAQDDCATTLTKAQKLFEAGAIEQIPQLLQPCIENGFTKEENLQAQKLIVLSFLFDNNVTEAEHEMLEFLQKNPEYEILPNDQAEFVQLFNTYRTLPIASLGIRAGIRFTYPSINERFTVGDVLKKDGVYNPLLGYQVGLSYNMYLAENIDLCFEPLYQNSKFEYVDSKLLNSNSLTYTETQTGVELPISGTYTYKLNNKWLPYARLGAGVGYLLSADADANRVVTGVSKPVTGSAFSVLPNRNQVQVWAIAGVGMKFKVPHGLLFVDFRYNVGLTKLAKPSTKLSNSDEIWNYYYIDSDITLDQMSVTAGYAYTFYKPRKK